ncbi:MAG: GFA family protein [Novosphingobium sp.]|nr:GFA family protein [Novosphingobium sp.]
MTNPRTASCQCGQLVVTCRGEPVRISVCHCLACQKRSGAPFAAQVRYPEDQVKITGESREWVRTADSGKRVEHHFCPQCGSTVWYRSRPHADAIAVSIGAFADPAFPAPWFSVYEQRRHPWVEIVGEGIEHSD